MKVLYAILDRLNQHFCKHEWIRDRRPDGDLWLQCRKCMKQKEHDLLRIIRWRPRYKPEVWPPDYREQETRGEDKRTAA